MGITSYEVNRWSSAAESVAVPYDEVRAIPQQDQGSTHRERWNFAATAHQNGYPLLLHSPYVEIYRKQVVKQADLVLAMHWCGDQFTPQEKAKAFAYYEEITVRDSSLSASTQCVIAAEVGHLELAHAYLREAALMDLRDLEHNTRDGLHIASLAGAWLGVVCGFGGLRDHGGRLRFAPRLPKAVSSLAFTIRWHGSRVRVDVTRNHARYTLRAGSAASVQIFHHDAEHTVTAGAPLVLPIPMIVPLTHTPTQPVGRSPEMLDQKGAGAQVSPASRVT